MRPKLFLIFLVLMFGSVHVHGQQEPSIGQYYWLDLSGGFGKGATGAISINGEILDFTLGVEYRENIFGEINFFGPPSGSAKCLNIKGGKLFKGSWWFVHLSGGLGYAYQRIPHKVGETGGWFSTGIYEYEKESTLGIIVSSEIAVKLDVYKLGLAVGAATAGNRHVLFVGLNLGFGKFF